MKFAIYIKTSPFHRQACLTAQRFIHAALQQGHEVWRVFFYQEGVYNAAASSLPPQDESHVVDGWVQLHEVHGVELIVCSSAGMRRGVLDEATATRQGERPAQMHAAFRTGSLLQLVDAMSLSDRFMVFEG